MAHLSYQRHQNHPRYFLVYMLVCDWVGEDWLQAAVVAALSGQLHATVTE